MNLTLDTITTMLADGWRPTRGRCFIHLDTPPTMSGLLHIPERSQEIQIKDAVWGGRVLAIAHRWEEDKDDDMGGTPMRLVTPVGPGDRVLLLLRAEDMDRTVIITDNTRIVAVIEE